MEIIEGSTITEEHIVVDPAERKYGWQLKASNAGENIAFEALMALVPSSVSIGNEGTANDGILLGSNDGIVNDDIIGDSMIP